MLGVWFLWRSRAAIEIHLLEASIGVKSGEPVELYLGGGFRYFLFSPLPGEMIQFDEHIFQMGWFNHQLVIFYPTGTMSGDLDTNRVT